MDGFLKGNIKVTKNRVTFVTFVTFGEGHPFEKVL